MQKGHTEIITHVCHTHFTKGEMAGVHLVAPAGKNKVTLKRFFTFSANLLLFNVALPSKRAYGFIGPWEDYQSADDAT